jgi:hypothetical protein
MYKTNFGILNLFGVWANRIFWTAILVLTIVNFEQNPNGLTILILIITIILLRIRTDQLTINNQTIEIRKKMFFDLIPVTTTINKNEITEIQIIGNRSVGNNLIQNMLPIGVKLKNRIIFNLDNGKVKSLKTDLFLDELQLFKEKIINEHPTGKHS